jgi:hypothetical protein
MIRKSLHGLAFVAAAAFATTANAATSYELGSVTLLQPDAEVKARLGADALPLADYIRAINTAEDKALKDAPDDIATAAVLYIAVRPNGASKVWFAPEMPVRADVRRMIVKAAMSAATPAVSGGTLVFALDIGLGGAKAPAKPDIIPSDWFVFMEGMSKNNGMSVPEVVDLIWK